MTSSDKKKNPIRRYQPVTKRKLNPRRNYARGANAERFIRNDLLVRGFPVVIRAAGSKSPGMKAKVDLIAVIRSFRGDSDTFLIQVKPSAGKIPIEQVGELSQLAQEINGCAYEAWKDKLKARYKCIYCTHTADGWGPSCPLYGL